VNPNARVYKDHFNPLVFGVLAHQFFSRFHRVQLSAGCSPS
jgi:hypothetical protein